jgi:hypothetical protein
MPALSSGHDTLQKRNRAPRHAPPAPLRQRTHRTAPPPAEEVTLHNDNNSSPYRHKNRTHPNRSTRPPALYQARALVLLDTLGMLGR